MLPTQKCFACELPTENRNCLRLPTKVSFFEKVPTEGRKRLGATHTYEIKPRKKESRVLFLCLHVYAFKFKVQPGASGPPLLYTTCVCVCVALFY